jgi:hypothetical protein
MIASGKHAAHAPATSADGELRWAGHMADDVSNTYGPDPLATLSATAGELVLTGSRGTFRVPREAVTALRRGKFYPWFFSALSIKHTVAGYPVSLQFKPQPGHWREVLKQLETLGYPVA